MTHSKTCKLLVFGQSGSGKSEFVKKLKNPNAQFDPTHKKTLADFTAFSHHEIRFHIWETTGFMTSTYAKGTHVNVLCVDVSSPLDLVQLYQSIHKIRTLTMVDGEHIPLFLVWTKTDLPVHLSTSEIDDLKAHLGNVVAGRFEISSKEGRDLEPFMTAITELVAPDEPDETVKEYMERALYSLPSEGRLYKKINKLKTLLPDLTYEQQKVISTATLDLVNRLTTNEETQSRFEAINDFERIATEQLGGSHPVLGAVITAVVVTALVTVIAAAVGFGIGFAAGAWTGPGAFITGVMTGSAAACSTIAISASLGAEIGFFAGYFQHQNSVKENNPIDKITEAASTTSFSS